MKNKWHFVEEVKGNNDKKLHIIVKKQNIKG